MWPHAATRTHKDFQRRKALYGHIKNSQTHQTPGFPAKTRDFENRGEGVENEGPKVTPSISRNQKTRAAFAARVEVASALTAGISHPG
jgi:hypothetical protein